MPGTFPTRLTTIRRRLFPVRTFTALLIVMLSKLMPFTSTSLSPTVKPASSVPSNKETQLIGNSLYIHVQTSLLQSVLNTLTCYNLKNTCRAVVLHLTDKNPKAVFRASTHAEAQSAILTFVHGNCVDVFTVIPTYSPATSNIKKNIS